MASIYLGQFNGSNTSYGAYNVSLLYDDVTRIETTITITNVRVYYEKYSSGWTTNRLATTGSIGNGQNAWYNHTINNYGSNSPATYTHALGNLSVTGVDYLTSTVSFNVQAKGTGSSTNWANTSGTVQLNYTGTISVPIINKSTVTATNADIEAATSININRYSTSHTHTLRYAFGELSGTIVTGVTTSYGWTIPTSFYAQIPNTLSGTCTIYCDTYNGATYIGTNTCTFTASVNQTNNKPSISYQFEDINDDTIYLTGATDKVVKYFSNVRFYLTATAKNSATLTLTKVTCADGKSVQSSFPNSPVIINLVESGDFTIEAKDSRGLSTYLPVSKTMINYAKLTFNTTVYRTQPTNNTIALTFNGNYFNDTFGSVSNQLGDTSGQHRIYWKYREKGAVSWENEATINVTRSGNTYNNGASPITLGTSFDYTKAYEFSFRVLDKLTTLSVPIQTVAQGLPMFSASPTNFVINSTNAKKGTYDILTTNYIVDNLTSTSTTDVLSANQGKVLNDNKLDIAKGRQMMCGFGSSTGYGQTLYVALGNSSTAYSGFVTSSSGTISNLYVYTDGSPGENQSYTCTMMKDNSATSLTCTIPAGSNNAADEANSFTVTANQRLNLRFVCSASAVGTTIIFGFTFKPS